MVYRLPRPPEKTLNPPGTATPMRPRPFLLLIVGFALALMAVGEADAGWSMDTDLSDADASFWGEGANDWSGGAVSGAGDVNADGYDDFIIGACGDDDGGTSAGQTYLILGKVTFSKVADDITDLSYSPSNLVMTQKYSIYLLMVK